MSFMLYPRLKSVEFLYVIPAGAQSERARKSGAYRGGIPGSLAESGPAAALAFDHLVALLQQALALAILALLLFLDIGTFVIGHDILPR
jgi:hypothetical protein